MGCLYYIPARRFPEGRVPDVLKSRRVLPDASVSLEDAGLGHLAGVQLTYRAVRNAGPDKGAGLVIGLRMASNETGCFLAEQTWQPVDGGELFVGWKTGEQPGPEVFLRDGALPGTSPVTLADGKVWEFIPSGALPEVMTVDTAGQMVFRPRAQDAAHFAASEWLMDYLMAGGARSYTEIVERLVVCLQARYHVGLQEFLALGLFTTDLNTRVVLAALGLDFDEVVGGKKNGELTESDTNSGSPDDCPG